MKIYKMVKVSVRLILVGIVLFSVIYPLSVGVFGQIWGNASRGSLIEKDEEIVGSKIIGQQFIGLEYFHSRPSTINYDSSKSGSANLGPLNPALEERVKADLKNIADKEITETGKVPVDMIAESGSALDPHIALESAYFQVPRISNNTGISRARLNELIEKYTSSKLLGLYGLERVNVLKLNLAIEEELNK